MNDPSPAAGEPGLTSILQTMFGPTAPTSADQHGAGMWTFAGYPPSMIPTLAFEYAGGASTQIFGIWFGSDTADLFHYDIFTGSATGVNNGGATAAGVQVNGTTLVVFGAECGRVNCTPPGGVTNSLVGTSFGFYLRTDIENDGIFKTLYTVDQLNLFGMPGALAFQHGATTNWALAFEDGADLDFNDAVVKVESINPVPEPGSMLLLGTGLFGLGNALRRRFRTSKQVPA